MLDLLFETSWEVCNRVGGIYAVLSTKAKTLQKKYKDRVIFIGPDLWRDGVESPFFTETKTPVSAWLKHAVLPSGMRVRVGRWNVPGKPIAILVDYRSLFSYKNELYACIWDEFKVDSLHAYGDYDDSCMFAYGAALVIESIIMWNRPTGKVVAHFDEWTTGMGLLYVKSHMPQVATVFTTHATSIGRSICCNGKPLYDYMAGYYGDQMACELNMQSKHSLEKAAANAADVFTTVSEVTARECVQLLEREPMVTPNAFEPTFVPKGAKYLPARATARSKMLNVAKALTGIDFADDTMIIATSGRNEYRNKGLDMYLDAINQIRHWLNVCDCGRRVLTFILVPGWTKGPRPDLVENARRAVAGTLPNPVITHSIHNPESDNIYCRINSLGFTNSPAEKLTVIYVPSYLNGDDGVFDLSYYDVLVGLDLTIFPSYYEPWGYTPLESIAFGVPTITSNLSGFGQWILSNFGDNYSKCGTKVVKRTDSNYEAATAEVAVTVGQIYDLKPAEWAKLSKESQSTSKSATWDKFMSYYEIAYKKAIQHAEQRNGKTFNNENKL